MFYIVIGLLPVALIVYRNARLFATGDAAVGSSALEWLYVPHRACDLADLCSKPISRFKARGQRINIRNRAPWPRWILPENNPTRPLISVGTLHDGRFVERP
ncbi:MAG TPA: hypothetical protein VN046_03410 [Stenotrophobium sp.]|nr:hypothetical protein [Stenotrophobium sp.]